MQITDINDFISTAAQLLNAPDLILIAVLLANVWLGARRGLVGALYGVIGRIGMIAASVAAAKYTAPYIAQWVVVPAVGQLFEKQAALKTAEGVLDGLRQTVTEAAVGMSESIAFSMLVVLFSVLFGRLIWIFGRSLKLIVRRTPLSALDSAGGALIGFVTRRRIRLHPADRAAVAVPDHLYVARLSLAGARQAYAAAQTACGRFTYRHLMENTLILHFPFFNFPFPKGV